MLSAISQIVVTCALSWVIWKVFRHVFIRSPLDNIPGPASSSFIWGNLRNMVLDRNGWGFLRHLTHSYDGIAKLHGPFGRRMLYVFDPVALHNIVLKDQHIYEETAFFQRVMEVTLGPGLLATLGEQHRRQRRILTPVFSIAHLRRMHSVFSEIGCKLVLAIENGFRESTTNVREVDMLSWMARTALELIGQSGLGYSFDPLIEDTPDEFAEAVKLYQPTLMETSILHRLLPFLCTIGSPAFRRKVVELIPSQRVQRLKTIVDTIHRRSQEIFEERKRALKEGDEAMMKQVGEGKDIMSVLLRANMEAYGEDRMSEEELIGQMSTLIMAAMDTTSNALAMTLHLLSEHVEVQEKLREELLTAYEAGDVGYDLITSLPYLDAVCRETLRLHPPISNNFRETREDVILPLSRPIKGVDGSSMTQVLIPKNTTVITGNLSSNTNPALWGEDAQEWKPERWLSPLPDALLDAKLPGVYSNLMTFLGGGRSCIGFKFSQLEMKVVLSLLITKFTFAPSEQPISWVSSGIIPCRRRRDEAVDADEGCALQA